MEAPISIKEYIRRDLGWVNGRPVRSFLLRYFGEGGFKYIVWLRLTRFFILQIIDFYLFCAELS